MNWQDKYLKGITLEELMEAQQLTDDQCKALLYLCQNISDAKIKETFKNGLKQKLSEMLSYCNKISPTDLIKSGTGEYKTDQQIKNAMNNYSDNYVAYKKGDDFGKRIFDIIVSSGCCGSKSFEVNYLDSIWVVHFNYGH